MEGEDALAHRRLYSWQVGTSSQCRPQSRTYFNFFHRSAEFLQISAVKAGAPVNPSARMRACVCRCASVRRDLDSSIYVYGQSKFDRHRRQTSDRPRKQLLFLLGRRLTTRARCFSPSPRYEIVHNGPTERTAASLPHVRDRYTTVQAQLTVELELRGLAIL